MPSKYDLELIKTEKHMARDRRLQRTGIPVRFLDATWDDYKNRTATEHIPPMMQAYAESFMETRGHGGRGFLLQGPPGVGKTFAACLLGVQLSDMGCYVRFTTLAKYVETLIRQITLQQAWQKYESLDAFQEWETTDEELRRMRETAHLVIVDDVGREHRTSSNYSADSFDEFLRNRVAIGRPVVMTSNVSVDKWTQRYSEAMGSFVFEAAEVVGITEDDDMRRATF